jgi:hypothetical protein
MSFGALKFPVRFSAAALLIAGAMASMGIIVAVLGPRLSDNVHAIELGEAYRSGQLWPGELEQVVESYGIRSIISLDAPVPDAYWYRGELAVSAAKSLARYEMPLSPERELTGDQLRQLLSLLQAAPKPVLIHSRNGADRSGLAAAIFEYSIARRPADEARNQLSIRFGHLPLILTGTDAMDASFRKFLRQYRPTHRVDEWGATISSRPPSPGGGAKATFGRG